VRCLFDGLVQGEAKERVERLRRDRVVQVDVELPGVCTIFKGYMEHGTPEIGMTVQARFRSGEPTNTILDMYWVPGDE